MTPEDDKKPFGEESSERSEDTERKKATPAAGAESAKRAADASNRAEAGNDDGDDPEGRADPATDPVAALEAEVADLKDKLLRALAETENVRRRAQREKDDANKYAIASFAREMIEVRDNLRRALDTVEEGLSERDETVKTFVEGVEMTEKNLLSAFEQFNIEPIEAMNKKFDHNLHEALFEVEDPSVPAGTVVQVVQGGYMIHDRLLRPAKVGVSKGGEKAQAGPAQEQETDGGADGAKDGGPAQKDPSKASSKAYEQSSAGSGARFDEKL